MALSSEVVTDDGADLSAAGDDGEGEEEAIDEDLVDVQDEGEILGEVCEGLLLLLKFLIMFVMSYFVLGCEFA